MEIYVCMQQDVIATLHKLERDHPKVLRGLVEKYCEPGSLKPPPYLSELCPYGLDVFKYCGSMDSQWVIQTTAEIIRQQIAVEGDKITIRNLLGDELYPFPDMGYTEYIQERGSGQNRLRTKRLAQPGALREGDILANGDKLLAPPREGGNGLVLIQLTGGTYGHWIGVPARIPIALWTEDDNAPQELIEP